MDRIRVKDKSFELYINRTTIQNRIAEIAQQIDSDYTGKSPMFIGVLNGAFIFAADLIRALSIPSEISFIKLSSYNSTTTTGSVKNIIGLKNNISDRHIIIVEDIVDTGTTMQDMLEQLKAHTPASIAIATLLSKPDARKFDIKADYTGFEIPDKFVVGYGLDYDEHGRDLPDIYQVTD